MYLGISGCRDVSGCTRCRLDSSAVSVSSGEDLNAMCYTYDADPGLGIVICSCNGPSISAHIAVESEKRKINIKCSQ